MKINKKTVSHFLGLAVLFGAVELTHQLTKTEEQVTYSVTLESLALGNGETDGENGGGGTDGETGGGGSTDGESDGGTTGGTTGGGTGNSTPSGNGANVKVENPAQKNVTVTIELNGRIVTAICDSSSYTVCSGRGNIPCTPVVRELTNCREKAN